MILYVNGDSHTAGAEAVNPHVFAEDDGQLYHLGRRPHPENFAVSWGWELSRRMNSECYCDAESASSNDRIIRTTRKWIAENSQRLDRTVFAIQWSTWEREEWLHDDVYWQVNASGIDDVPLELQARYKQFVVDVDWDRCVQDSHTKIWDFHQELKAQNIRHVFFNGNSHFGAIQHQKDWGVNYLAPYDAQMTYDQLLKNNGFATVSPESWHFGPAAHSFWANYMLQYMLSNQIVTPDEIPAY